MPRRFSVAVLKEVRWFSAWVRNFLENLLFQIDKQPSQIGQFGSGAQSQSRRQGQEDVVNVFESSKFDKPS
jgi:hypothetical protein